jgi:hypothetical protein
MSGLGTRKFGTGADECEKKEPGFFKLMANGFAFAAGFAAFGGVLYLAKRAINGSPADAPDELED